MSKTIDDAFVSEVTMSAALELKAQAKIVSDLPSDGGDLRKEMKEPAESSDASFVTP